MSIVVIDFNNIYEVAVNDDCTSEDILSKYLYVSKCSSQNQYGEKYTFKIATHSKNLYSVCRYKETKPEQEIFYFIENSIDIAYWWAEAYPIIEQTANATTAAIGVATIIGASFAFVKWVRNSIIPNRKDEYIWVQNVISKDEWNVAMLSDHLSIPIDQAKLLLKGFGYVWDAQRMLYIKTEITDKLRKLKPKIR